MKCSSIKNPHGRKRCFFLSKEGGIRHFWTIPGDIATEAHNYSGVFVDVFYQETNYVTLLIFWLLIDVCFLLLHVSFIFDCLVYFFHYSVLRVRFYNKICITHP